MIWLSLFRSTIENPLIELEEKDTKIQVEESYSMSKRKSNVSNHDESVSPLDFIPNDEMRLSENLIEQVNWLDISEHERAILYYLILNLDENGYLPMTNEEISNQLVISALEVEQSIQSLQQLESLGVGARDLKNCLLIQAKEYYPDNALILSIITNYLELISERKWKQITYELNISILDRKKSS